MDKVSTRGLLVGFFGIGLVGRAAGSGWFLALAAIGSMAFAVEWVVADGTRLWMAIIVGLIVAWVPVLATVYFTGQDIFSPTPYTGPARLAPRQGRLSAALSTFTIGLVICLAAGLLPMWVLGYGCQTYQRGDHDVSAACDSALALPVNFLLAKTFDVSPDEFF